MCTRQLGIDQALELIQVRDCLIIFEKTMDLIERPRKKAKKGAAPVLEMEEAPLDVLTVLLPPPEISCLEIRTSQAATFRSLIDALKEFLDDANLECSTEHGLRISAIDPSQTILVQCVLPHFEVFACGRPLFIGVNMDKFFRLIKKMAFSNILGLAIDATQQDVLHIVAQAKAKSYSTKMPLLDLKHSDFRLPDSNFQAVVSLSSTELQKTVRDLADLAEEVELTKRGHTLCWKTAGKQQVSFAIEMGPDLVTVLHETEPHAEIRAVFALHHLAMFVKCTSLSPTVELSLCNDYMLVVKYQCGDLGTVRFAAVPRQIE